VTKDSFSYFIVIVLLRFALVLTLFGVCRSVYRRTPGGGGGGSFIAEQAPETMLTIKLQPSGLTEGGSLEIPVELYPIDVTAVQHEFFSERRAGIRFEDFLRQKMNGQTMVKSQLDRDGGTTLMLRQGTWWLYATLNGAVTAEWRLPVNVAGRRQEVELSRTNVYERRQTF
jgi:hypothetical protein